MEKKCFLFDTIEKLDTELNILEKEQYWINLFNSRNIEKGFNLQDACDVRISKKSYKEGILKNPSRPIRSIICIDLNSGEIFECSGNKEANLKTNIDRKKIVDLLSYWKTGKGRKSYNNWILVDKEIYDNGFEYSNKKKTYFRKVAVENKETGELTIYNSAPEAANILNINLNTLYWKITNPQEKESFKYFYTSS